MIEIRREKPDDIDAIRAINLHAFENPAEANLIDKLREECEDFESFVAVKDGDIVGHLLLTAAYIEHDNGEVTLGWGLAPMGILPILQKKGVGSKLIEVALTEIQEDKDHSFIIVLGHKSFYSKFGFVPASMFGVKAEWAGVPDEAFMIMKLKSPKRPLAGIAKYRPEFNDAI
ncbi:MAG: N-acetyltransferase [Alphaproteobacteria bacterium]|nr:N-acetyltransferase [Alphaproteobacteria bacterium]